MILNIDMPISLADLCYLHDIISHLALSSASTNKAFLSCTEKVVTESPS